MAQRIAGEVLARRVHRLIVRAVEGAVLPYVTLGALVVVAVLVLGGDIDRHLTAIESWVEAQGPRGWIAFVALLVPLTSAFFPGSVLAILAGALFGPIRGLAAVLVGNLVAAALQYGLARQLLRARIERWIAQRPSLLAIQRAVLRDEIRLQTLLRLTPLNPASLNYAMGAAGVRFPGFLLTALATTPHYLLEVYFGYAGERVARIAGRSAWAVVLHDAAVVGGLAACLLVVLMVTRAARRAVEQAVAASEPE